MAAIMALEGAEAALHGRSLHRFAIRPRRHHQLDADWKARGWRTADKKPVKNEDLWRRLDAARQRHEVAWHWVRGHADDPLNNRVDALAVAAMTPFKKAKRANASRRGSREIATSP